jgi:hypothetical protein
MYRFDFIDRSEIHVCQILGIEMEGLHCRGKNGLCYQIKSLYKNVKTKEIQRTNFTFQLVSYKAKFCHLFHFPCILRR